MESSVLSSDNAQIVVLIESHNQIAERIGNIPRNERFLRKAKGNEAPPTLEIMSSRETTPYVPFDTPCWELRLDQPPFQEGQWIFGSSSDPTRCDFQLAIDQSLGVSRQHFKIFHNKKSGALCIGNLSSRGTIIRDRNDSKHLRGEGIIEPTQPLTVRAGTLQLQLMIPKRSPEEQTQHISNLCQFLSCFHGQITEFEASESVDPTPACVPFESGELKLDLVLQRDLAQGSFASIYLGVHKYTGDLYAVKQIHKNKLRKHYENADKRLANEMELAKRVIHENIIRFYQINNDHDHSLYIIMEFAKLGDLHKQMEEDRFTQQEIHTIASQQCGAVAYLHQIGITHRDIKPGNILLESRKPLVTKLADFGESSLSPSLKTYSGTEIYQAPELRNKESGDTYDNKIDVWSLGLVFVQLLEPEIEIRNLYMIPEKCQGTLAELCQSMLVIDPIERATAQRCVEFIKSHTTVSWINEESPNEPESSKKRNMRNASTNPKRKRNKPRISDSC